MTIPAAFPVDPHYPRDLFAIDDEVGALRATLELAPIGIAHFNTEGRFQFVNDRLCTMLGYARAHLLSLRFDEITFPEDRDACYAANARLAAGEAESYRIEKRFIRSDGSAIWTCVTVSAVRTRADDIAFFVGVAEDISEAKAHDEARVLEQERTERLLELEQQARSRAERANRMRDDLLAVVAHDLRNPLHTLQLSAMAMAEPEMRADDRARQADLIGRVVSNMDHLIGELLDIGRIEAGSFAVTPAPEQLQQLLDETMDMFRPQAEERHVRLVREDPPDPCTLMCDRDQLLRVLSNLVGNAMKFTAPDGEIRIRTSIMDDSVHVAVRDTGPGIPADDLEHVFDRFWQADRTRRFGTGLGLVIAKGIVESHGGRIWAESTVGVGSCFHFTLPLA